jgi:hypothetical protein
VSARNNIDVAGGLTIGKSPAKTVRNANVAVPMTHPYLVTEQGRVEITNYRTVEWPSDFEIPKYIKDVLGGFYQATFDTQGEAARHASLLHRILLEHELV